MPTSPDICRGQISWDYDRAEIIADGVVHALGVCLGLIGAVVIVVIAVKSERIEVAPILVYVIGLVTMLGLSATYNMWPVSPAKWVLLRFDHSAIYLLIAGTYTPFLAQMKSVLASVGLGVGVWLSALIGIALKLALPGRFDRLAVVLCLLLGWSGVIAYDSLASALPSASLWLLAIGGILYSVGALFHVWQGARSPWLRAPAWKRDPIPHTDGRFVLLPKHLVTEAAKVRIVSRTRRASPPGSPLEGELQAPAWSGLLSSYAEFHGHQPRERLDSRTG